jgi:hypothetical protein
MIASAAGKVKYLHVHAVLNRNHLRTSATAYRPAARDHWYRPSRMQNVSRPEANYSIAIPVKDNGSISRTIVLIKTGTRITFDARKKESSWHVLAIL